MTPIRLALALLSMLAIATPSVAEPLAKQLFGAKKSGSARVQGVFGSYAKGCIGGAVQLPETGPTWQAMRLSRNRNWGHPDLISFIGRLGKSAQRAGWAGIYVGDLSQPRGGPMLTGHRSHQIGLDADIWMLPPTRLNLTRQECEDLSSNSIRTKDQRNVNGNWTAQHMAVLRAAAKDKAVARIFVTAAAKIAMCEAAPRGDRAWLRKIRPWWGHHYHFHVRLKCPAGSRGCVNQAAPPPGDGCAEARQWVKNILNPPPPDPNPKPRKPRRELTMADLPNQCVQVLQSR